MSFFISYRRASKEFVLELERRIEVEGIFVWVDHDIEYGDKWKEAIDRAINKSTGMIVVVTIASLESPYVTYEWSFAMGLGKEVIFLILELPEDGNIHPKISDIHWLDFRDGEKWDELITRLKVTEEKLDIPERILSADRILRTSHKVSDHQEAIAYLEADPHQGANDCLGFHCKSEITSISIEASLALSKKSNDTDNRVIPGLIWAIQDTRFENKAIMHLSKLNTAEAVQGLLTVLEKVEKQRSGGNEKIIEALGDMTCTEAITAVGDKLKDKKWHYAALRAVQKLGKNAQPLASQLWEIFIDSETHEGNKKVLVAAIVENKDFVSQVQEFFKTELVASESQVPRILRYTMPPELLQTVYNELRRVSSNIHRRKLEELTKRSVFAFKDYQYEEIPEENLTD